MLCGLLPIFAAVTPSAVAADARRIDVIPTEAQWDEPDGRRVALVVGNGAYANVPPLAGAPTDAQLVADQLTALGFVVTVVLDADRDRFEEELRTFSTQLRGASAGLFYYAGHGVELGGTNYLLPVDVELRVPDDLAVRGIHAQEVQRVLEESVVPVAVIVLDACRNNPFSGGGGGLAASFASDGLARMGDASVLFAFSAAPGTVAQDLEHVYAGPLATHLAQPCRGILDDLVEVHEDVVEKTQRRQEPWVSGTLSASIRDFQPALCPAPGGRLEAAASTRAPSSAGWPRLTLLGPARGPVARPLLLAVTGAGDLGVHWEASVPACSGTARDGRPVAYPRFGRRCPGETLPAPLFEVELQDGALVPPVVGAYTVRAGAIDGEGALGPLSRRHLWVRPRNPLFVGVTAGGILLPLDPFDAGAGRAAAVDARVHALGRVNQGALLGGSHEFLLGASVGALLADPLDPRGAGLLASLETADRFTGARGQSGVEFGLSAGVGTYTAITDAGNSALTPLIPVQARLGPYVSLRKSYYDDGGERCVGNLCGNAFVGPTVGVVHYPEAQRTELTAGLTFLFGLNP